MQLYAKLSKMFKYKIVQNMPSKRAIDTTSCSREDIYSLLHKPESVRNHQAHRGITAPISLVGPSMKDLAASVELSMAVQALNLKETEDEIAKRMEALEVLNSLATGWVQKKLMEKGFAYHFAIKGKAKILPYGSTKLGVHLRESDIDAVFVAPDSITRSGFFTSFFYFIKSQPEVSHCRAIPAAAVPLITFNFSGIDIDLSFTQLTLKTVPDKLKLDDERLYKNMSQKDIKSINGIRVAEEILRHVPNVETFKEALIVIKIWAKGELTVC